MVKNYFNTRGKRRLLGVLLGLGLFVTALPWIVQTSLVYWLSSSGVGEARIANTDVNLFAGTFAVEQFLIERENNEKLYLGSVQLDISMSSLLQGQLQVEAVSIADSRLWLVQIDSGWEFVVPVQTGSAANNDEQESGVVLPRLGASIAKLTNVDLMVDSQYAEGRLRVNKLVLERASSWNQDVVTALKLDADWGDAKLAIELDANLLAAEPSLKGNLQLSRFPLSETLTLAQPVLSALVGQLDIDFDFAIRQKAEQQLSVDLRGSIGVTDLAVAQQDASLQAGEVSWKGSVNLEETNTQQSVALQGVLTAKRLGIEMIPAPQWSVSLQAIRLDDLDLSVQLPGNAVRFSAGEIAAQSLALQNAEVPAAQLALDQLSAQGLQLAENLSAELAAIRLDGLGFYRPVADKPFDLQFASLQIGPINYQVEPASLSLGRLDLESAELGLRIDDSGALEMLAAVEKLVPAEQSETEPQAVVTELPPPATANAAQALQWSLDEFAVSGNSVMRLFDARLEPKAKLKLELDTLTVGPISSGESASPMRIEVSGRMDRYGIITATGEGNLLATVPNLDLQGKLQEIPLPLFSPYTAAYMGYYLNSGQLDLDFDLNVADEKLAMKNTLLLRGLELSAVTPGEVKMLGTPLNLPMGIALDLLRDGDGNIKLKLPLKGKLHDPDVNISDVINTALAKAMRGGASSILKLAIQPYGAVLMAGEMIAGQMANIRLDPLEFEAGGVQAAAAQADYVQKIGSLLTERAGLQLTLCGLAGAADNTALAAMHPEQPVVPAELTDLADQRANWVKDELVALGLASNRMLICKPQYLPEGKPSVSLAL